MTTATPAREPPRQTIAEAAGVAIVGVPTTRPNDDADPHGYTQLLGCSVGKALSAADTRAMIDALDDAFQRGRASVATKREKNEDHDEHLASLLDSEAKLEALLGEYVADLESTEREHVVTSNATYAATKKGDDPGQLERQQAALAQRVEQLRARVRGTRDGLAEVVASARGRRDEIGRAVRAKLREQAEQELTQLNAEVAAALFDRLERLTELRGTLSATQEY